jgi:cysteinyl-tRNA synthetase
MNVWRTGLVFVLIGTVLAACNFTFRQPKIVFLNVSANQVLTGTFSQGPGITLDGANPSNAKLELLDSTGQVVLVSPAQPEVPVCLTNKSGGVCFPFVSSVFLNGNYSLRATVTLPGGDSLTDTLKLQIQNPTRNPSPPGSPPPAAIKPVWNDVDSWGIQYHNFHPDVTVAVDQLEAVKLDLVVLGRFDGVGREWQRNQILRLAQKKWVFSYLSVGQAQRYETYWKPGWVSGNPAWVLNVWTSGGKTYPDTFNVAYWEPAWQQIMFDTIDRIIAAGFDGVFIDQSDPYWNDSFPGGASEQNIARSRDLVCNLYDHIQQKKPGFKLIANGGGNQIDAFGPNYWKCLDGNAAEHMWYSGDGNFRQDGYRDYTLPQLQRLVVAGKKVFTFDYTNVSSEIGFVLRESGVRGFIPTVTDPAISTTPRTF